MRIILILSSLIISDHGYLFPMPCDKVSFLMGTPEKTLKSYPECASYFSGYDTNKVVLVPATMQGNGSNATAALSLTFGAAFWLAFILHAVGVEIYVRCRRMPAVINRADLCSSISLRPKQTGYDMYHTKDSSRRV